MEKICAFITGFKIEDEKITKQKLKKAITTQIFKGNHIFVINNTDEFNSIALDICKNLKKEIPFIQIFHNNNDYSIHTINILFCISDLTHKELEKLPYKFSNCINIFSNNNGQYESYNLSKYFSTFTLK